MTKGGEVALLSDLTIPKQIPGAHSRPVRNSHPTLVILSPSSNSGTSRPVSVRMIPAANPGHRVHGTSFLFVLVLEVRMAVVEPVIVEDYVNTGTGVAA